MTSNEKEFCGIVDAWEKHISEKRYDFETLYSYLFASKIGTPVAKRLLGLVSFDWYDPDTSYEDDVLAFIRAAKEKRDEIRSQKQTLADRIEEIIKNEEDLAWSIGNYGDGWMDAEALSQKIAQMMEAK